MRESEKKLELTVTCSLLQEGEQEQVLANLQELKNCEGGQIIRTIQEALINVRKHAQVDKAPIRLSHKENHICICIEDEGQRFDITDYDEEKFSSFGLQLMKKRMEGIGGRLETDTSPG